jgi:asparaginyl-tRNA synthetase
MKSINIKELYNSKQEWLGKKVTVDGWIRTTRDSKAIAFIELNDGTFHRSLQFVLEKEKIENFENIVAQGVGTALKIEGDLIETPNSKQPFEVNVTNAQVMGKCDADYPLQKKRHSVEFLRTIPHLRQRTNLFSAVFRVRSLMAFAIHKFFMERDFVYVHTPIFTGMDCEGVGEMFQVTTLNMENIPKLPDGTVDYSEDFFGHKVHITGSGQLMGECYAMAFKNIYTFGPTFRSENSNTTRHAAEFWMIEPEMAFADLNDNMKIAEDMIRYIISYLLQNAPEEMAFFNEFVDKELFNKLNNVVNSQFKQITYTEAIKILKESGQKFENKAEWGEDLATEHERYISEVVFKCPVFVTNYPRSIKPYYMKVDPDGKTVAAMDLLVPGVGEIIGGSQREESPEKIAERLEEMGMPINEHQFYLDIRRFGGVYHAGFGLGFERMLMYVTGVSNIRDVIPFPRTAGNCDL